MLATLRDGLLRRSEAAALTWGDVEFRDNGSALLQLRRSKTDQEAEGVTLYIGTETSQALQAIRPTHELLDPATPVFGMTTRHIGNRVRAAAKAAGLGEGFTGPRTGERRVYVVEPGTWGCLARGKFEGDQELRVEVNPVSGERARELLEANPNHFVSEPDEESKLRKLQTCVEMIVAARHEFRGTDPSRARRIIAAGHADSQHVTSVTVEPNNRIE